VVDLGEKARRLERRIARTVDAAVTELVGASQVSPIEIVHAVLDAAEREVQEVGRGRRVFPFNHLRVHVVAAAGDREARARFAAVVEGPPSLNDRLGGRLQSAGCAPISIAIETVFVAERGNAWVNKDFHVEFDRVEGAAIAGTQVPQVDGTNVPAYREVPPYNVTLVVAKGTAAREAYWFPGGRIDVGRRPEVVDQKQRLVRTNHVAFNEDDSEVNASVSRRHAHIELTADGYRVWDDGSAQGTSIMRNGKTIKVPAGARGVRLESGDELVLGQARLRVTIN
jgi:hypothetical protein